MSIVSGNNIPVMARADDGDAYGPAMRQVLRMMQALIQCSVINLTTTTPPNSPANGDRYVVAVGGSGAWSGKDNSIAHWTTNDPLFPSGTWEFWTPLSGWRVASVADGVAWAFNGTSWVIQSAVLKLNTPVNTTGLQASVTSTTLFTPAATGMFRIGYYLKITTPASSSSAVQLSVSWTSGTDAVAQSKTGANVTGNSATSLDSGSIVVFAASGIPVTYAVSYTSVGGTSAIYEIHIRVEAI